MNITSLLCVALLLVSHAAADEILKEGPLRGLDVSAYAPEQRELLKKANEDCADIENYRLPRHAEPSPSGMKDGGSRYFFGDKYSILLRKTFFPPAVTNTGLKGLGYAYGYELFMCSIEDLDKHAGMHSLVSKVWFVTEERLLEISRGTQEELEKRMPPFEKYFRLVPVEPETKEKANKPAQTTPGS